MTPLKPSHLHLAFDDFPSAVAWFRQVLALEPVHEAPGIAVLRLDGLEVCLHPAWGDGDTAMTFALQSSDCRADYERAVQRGARPRTPPRDKGDVVGADVFGPGKLVIEWEQLKANKG